MKKVFFVMMFIVFAFVGCTDEETSQQTTEVVYDNFVSIIIGEDEHQLGFNDQEDSLFELIQASDINLDFNETEFGPMIIEIGDYTQDAFHWIGFTKNDDFAEEGLDTINYQDGDTFQFNLNQATWDQSFNAIQLKAINETSLIFDIDGYEVFIEKNSVDEEKLFVGSQYTFTGQPLSISEGAIEFEVSEFTHVFNYISVVIDDETYDLLYRSDTEKSAFDLIEESDIALEYLATDFGPMITSIGDLQQDDFHWISFTINDEFASEGLDTLDFEDRDIIKFTEELSTWEITLEAEITEINQDEIVFQNENQAFVIDILDLPESVNIDDLVVGFIYTLTGTVDTEFVSDHVVFNPTILELVLIDDFTDLYDLEIGDVFILEFTVTYIEDSSAFGNEIFAEDINDLSSTEISENMTYESVTNYMFYTIPDEYELVINNTYIGRFIYQVNAPSQVPQITLYELSINGEELDNIIVE